MLLFCSLAFLSGYRLIVSVVSCMFMFVIFGVYIYAQAVIAISIRLIIIANVVYWQVIFFVNFLVPICNAQIPKINANTKVNSVALIPNINPDNIVINAYVAIVVVA